MCVYVLAEKMGVFIPTAALTSHLCEVPPGSEQYQSLPLYKSETFQQNSLLYVFLLSFQHPHLPNPILSNPKPNLVYSSPQPNDAWHPKCRCPQPKTVSFTCLLTVAFRYRCCLKCCQFRVHSHCD